MSAGLIRAMVIAGLCLVMVAEPVAALAAQPPTAPFTLQTEGFEDTGSVSEWRLIPDPPFGAPTNAAWGRVWPGWSKSAPSIRFAEGNAGLWAAGTWMMSTGRASYWNVNGYRYPARTRGIASWPVSDTVDCFEAWVDFAHLMPTLGGADTFTMGWMDGSTPNPRSTTRYPGRAAGWQRNKYRLTAPVERPFQDVNLSRTAGSIYFNFYDATEAAGQQPNGTGPIVDDVRIYAFKYGPPRDLVATTASGARQLSWTKPQRTTADSAPDERALTYRIWRRYSSSASWVELSTGRLSSPSFVDRSYTPNVTTYYLVQAWDVGSGARYGVPRQWRVSATGGVSRIARVSLSAPGAPKYGAAILLKGTLRDDMGVGLDSRTVLIEQSTSSSSGWSTVATLTSTSDGGFSTATSTSRSMYYRARLADDEYGTHFSSTQRALPMVSLSTPTTSKRTVRPNERFTATGTMRPVHAVGTKLILEARKSGSPTKRFTATVTSKSATSCTWRASVALGTRGNWSVRSYHAADSLNAATYSGSRTVTVR